MPLMDTNTWIDDPAVRAPRAAPRLRCGQTLHSAPADSVTAPAVPLAFDALPEAGSPRRHPQATRLRGLAWFDPGRVIPEDIDIERLAATWEHRVGVTPPRRLTAGSAADRLVPVDPLPVELFQPAVYQGAVRPARPLRGGDARHTLPDFLTLVVGWEPQAQPTRGRPLTPPPRWQPAAAVHPGDLPDASEIVPAAWLTAGAAPRRPVRGGRIIDGVPDLAFVVDVPAWAPLTAHAARPALPVRGPRAVAAGAPLLPDTDEAQNAALFVAVARPTPAPRTTQHRAPALTHYADLDVPAVVVSLGATLATFASGGGPPAGQRGQATADVPQPHAPEGWQGQSARPHRQTPRGGATYFVAPRWHGLSRTGGPYFVVAGDTFVAGAVIGQVQGQ